MKNLCIVILVCTLSPCFGQTNYVVHPVGMDITTNKYATTGVVHVDSMPAHVLLEAAYQWLSEVKYVNSAASKGINTDEAAFNRLRVNQYFFGTYSTKIRFVLYLEFRDGRYKFTFTDFSYFQTTARTDFEEVVNKEDKARLLLHLKDANSFVTEWVSEFTAYLNSYKSDDSW